jgi:hypothetical protein
MRSKLLSGLFAVALSCSALGQSLWYQNDGFLIAPPDVPPDIDALSFVNRGQFVINLTNQVWFLPPYQAPYPFETQRTISYTNEFGAFMSCNSGFRLETFVRDGLPRQMASAIHNEGRINCGTVDTTNTLNIEGLFFGQLIQGSTPMGKFLARATNIVNSGDIALGFEGIGSINGESVNLDRGSIMMETNGFSLVNNGFFYNGLLAAGYWGLGFSDDMSPAAYFGTSPARTPAHLVTNRNYMISFPVLGDSTFSSYYTTQLDASGSNLFVRAVFLSNTNSMFPANVYFPFGSTVVEWTNRSGGGDNLYLFDYFQFYTNFSLLLNGFSGNRPTYIPWNYDFFRLPSEFLFFFGQPEVPTTIPQGLFPATVSTNQYSAYRALLQPNSIVSGDTLGQTYANSPGRIEIAATNFLTMEDTRITSLNYLRVLATNHFGGTKGAQIASPYAEFNLRSTNNFMVISNLTQPSLSRPEGRIDCYSARWTNVVAGITNCYHVLFVDTRASTVAPTRMVGFTLRVTDPGDHSDTLYISDQVNIVSNAVLLECSRLAITTNATDAPVPFGSLTFIEPNIVWSGITPRLQYLTNSGMITAPNTMFFRGSRTSPYYSTNYNEPYYVFVNEGGVTNFSSRIYSTNFQNHGVFHATGGSIELHQAQYALLTNGMFLATNTAGTIIVESGDLFVSNHVMFAGSSINFAITNSLDDGSLAASGADGITNKNGWVVGNGINLLRRPESASLLGTTVTNRTRDYQRSVTYWAGADRGNDPAAFINNAALGRMILEGGFRCQYHFTGPGPGSAIYIDSLELTGGAATNVDMAGNFLSLSCDPNMRVYYGQALANGESIAQKLSSVNGGRFIWVSNYHSGFFCTTNVVYADGTTNRLNTALVNSCEIDSNGDGVPNCNDPSPVPVLTPAALALSVDYAITPESTALVSWKAFPKTENYLLSASAPDAKNWQVVTNFVYTGPFPDRVQVLDSIKTNVPRFYRVRVNSPQ